MMLWFKTSISRSSFINAISQTGAVSGLVGNGDCGDPVDSSSGSSSESSNESSNES